MYKLEKYFLIAFLLCLSGCTLENPLGYSQQSVKESRKKRIAKAKQNKPIPHYIEHKVSSKKENRKKNLRNHRAWRAKKLKRVQKRFLQMNNILKGRVVQLQRHHKAFRQRNPLKRVQVF